MFAPPSKYRARATPAKRGRGGRHSKLGGTEEPTLAERLTAMTWAQRLKRAFGIHVKTCPACSGAMRIMVCMEGAAVIELILIHLYSEVSESDAPLRSPYGAPSQQGLFDETR